MKRWVSLRSTHPTGIIPLSGKRAGIRCSPRLAAHDAMRHDRAENSKPQAMRREEGELYEESNNKYCRHRPGDVGERGAGAKQAAAQAWRHPRYVRALRGY